MGAGTVEEMIGEATGAHAPIDAGAAIAAVDLGRRTADDESDETPAPPGPASLAPGNGAPEAEAVPARRSHKRKRHRGSGRPPGRPRKTMDIPSPTGATVRAAVDETGARPYFDPIAAPDRATKAELTASLAAARGEAARLAELVASARSQNDAARLASLGGILAMCFDGVFRFLGQYRGPHWRLDAPDATNLGNVWSPVLAPHAAIIEEHGPLMIAAGTTLMLVRVRLAEDARLETLGPPVAEAPAS